MTNTATKIKGLKKAIGDYRRANAGGKFSPRYGVLMFDKSTGEIWCDEFYDLGRGEFKMYSSPDIIDLGAAYDNSYQNYCYWRAGRAIPAISMATIKAFIAEEYGIG